MNFRDFDLNVPAAGDVPATRDFRDFGLNVPSDVNVGGEYQIDLSISDNEEADDIVNASYHNNEEHDGDVDKVAQKNTFDAAGVT
ncbi:hypothetical protein LIER_27731 [Lithospermum erythrorhizon]|uniref:Uncharacterized protein n=1 Tax=Lithospermum erythrorhizon TaxID=34254 RepID=A0AAV3RDE1_LITER